MNGSESFCAIAINQVKHQVTKNGNEGSVPRKIRMTCGRPEPLTLLTQIRTNSSEVDGEVLTVMFWLL